MADGIESQDLIILALDKLKKEIEREPLSPEKVSALIETIKVLKSLNPLSRL